tara:strand:+ start:72 stop:722 length:651 start_codon:yes stop_codon:yes gene_type:complete
MSFLKLFISIYFFVSFIFTQNLGDMRIDNSSSENFQAMINNNSDSESILTVYSNANIHNIYIWESSLQPLARTFPAKISLPIANRSYTISLFPQSEYNFLKNEIMNFDFDKRDISELEILQSEFENMNIGTKSINPINGVNESIFLIFCDKEDFDCKDGLHWFDKFYAKFFDDSKKSSNFVNQEYKNRKEISNHRRGMVGILSLFAVTIFLIDNNQ